MSPDERRAVPALLPVNDPLAAAAIAAIHTGDVDGLRRLLQDVPALATVRVGDDRACRTLLHVVAGPSTCSTAAPNSTGSDGTA